MISVCPVFTRKIEICSLEITKNFRYPKILTESSTVLEIRMENIFLLRTISSVRETRTVMYIGLLGQLKTSQKEKRPKFSLRISKMPVKGKSIIVLKTTFK